MCVVRDDIWSVGRASPLLVLQLQVVKRCWLLRKRSITVASGVVVFEALHARPVSLDEPCLSLWRAEARSCMLNSYKALAFARKRQAIRSTRRISLPHPHALWYLMTQFPKES